MTMFAGMGWGQEKCMLDTAEMEKIWWEWGGDGGQVSVTMQDSSPQQLQDHV